MNYTEQPGVIKTYQLASNLLPHYLAKFECSAVQRYCKVTQQQNRLNVN